MPRPAVVIRRVGGLEVTHRSRRRSELVIRRVGGLEEHRCPPPGY